MTFHRILLVVTLSLAATLALSACGKKPAEQTAPPPEASAPATPPEAMPTASQAASVAVRSISAARSAPTTR